MGDGVIQERLSRDFWEISSGIMEVWGCSEVPFTKKYDPLDVQGYAIMPICNNSQFPHIPHRNLFCLYTTAIQMWERRWGSLCSFNLNLGTSLRLKTSELPLEETLLNASYWCCFPHENQSCFNFFCQGWTKGLGGRLEDVFWLWSQHIQLSATGFLWCYIAVMRG